MKTKRKLLEIFLNFYPDVVSPRRDSDGVATNFGIIYGTIVRLPGYEYVVSVRPKSASQLSSFEVIIISSSIFCTITRFLRV
jgi:hypothetical protein